jgi:HEAT repeat protein
LTHQLIGALTVLFATLASGAASAESVDDLVASVVAGDEGDRSRAAARLYHIGQVDAGVPPLVAQLRSEDPDARCLAARVLGILRSGRAVLPLVVALGDADWAVRRDAAEALGQIGDASAAQGLAGRLRDPHPRVRIAAARALREVRVSDALPGALGCEDDPEVRLHLVEALTDDRSRRATRALRRALDDPSELVRLLAATILVERGEPRAVEVIARRLGMSSVTARVEAVEALGRATEQAVPGAVRALGTVLGDPSPEVVLSAAASLARLGDSRGLETLGAVSRGDAPPDVRARALELLDQLGHQ